MSPLPRHVLRREEPPVHQRLIATRGGGEGRVRGRSGERSCMPQGPLDSATRHDLYSAQPAGVSSYRVFGGEALAGETDSPTAGRRGGLGVRGSDCGETDSPTAGRRGGLGVRGSEL